MRVQRQLGMLLAGMVIVSTACSRAGAGAAGAQPSKAAAPSTTCRAIVRGLDTSRWREVSAEGFSFCVPATWSGNGRTWRQGGGSITWGVGTHPRPKTSTTVVAVRASEIGSLQSGGPPPDSDVQRFSEEIGGRRADLWRNRFGREFHTGAVWSSPRVWLVGESQDATSADVQVMVFRTVRFGDQRD